MFCLGSIRVDLIRSVIVVEQFRVCLVLISDALLRHRLWKSRRKDAATTGLGSCVGSTPINSSIEIRNRLSEKSLVTKHRFRQQKFPCWFCNYPARPEEFPIRNKKELRKKPNCVGQNGHFRDFNGSEFMKFPILSGIMQRRFRISLPRQPSSPRFGEFPSNMPEMPANRGLSLFRQSLSLADCRTFTHKIPKSLPLL